ncbi:hypothetical protein [Parafannyhessea umbonata]|uniref:hypothetical protein n=1 Tax=Parafannyhessea umbonata TaxID=604330 RepID=UPI00359CA477
MVDSRPPEPPAQKWAEFFWVVDLARVDAEGTEPGSDDAEATYDHVLALAGI